MFLLTIANVQRLTLARLLESAGIPATVFSSLGTCSPWPIESGATALICGVPRETVETFARETCKARGEQCAALVTLSGTFDIVAVV